jgi:transcriptional regulator
MYVPSHFKEDRVEILHETIRKCGIGTLVTFERGEMIASHVPMLIDPEPAPYGTLIGHVSRGNPQGRAIDGAVETLALFLGAEAYVTPSWYATKRETGKVVPTWNYVAVHAYGKVRFFNDKDRLLDIVRRLTATHEAGRAEPWAVSDAPADFVDGLLKGIVGFELPIGRLEGKWKMSQNRPAEDRAGVVAGLRAEGETDVADIVAEVNAG